jgi:uncharacterized protein (DUF302 family)
MKKSLIASIFAVALALMTSGCSTMHMGWTAVTSTGDLDDQAMPAYDAMFTKVAKYGDPARAMMNEWKVKPDVTEEDVVESIKSLAEEYNMRVTGDIKMFTQADAKPNEVKHTRIFSLCSLTIAKVFLNYSRWYGGFMPCRIMYVEYGNGDRYLISMDMTLAIHGGKPLPPEMAKMAAHVKKAMEEIPAKAAAGDF